LLRLEKGWYSREAFLYLDLSFFGFSCLNLFGISVLDRVVVFCRGGVGGECARCWVRTMDVMQAGDMDWTQNEHMLGVRMVVYKK